MTAASPTPVFTVSQLNQRTKQLLEVSFNSIRVEGEISNLSRPASGHWYFTLKDSNAQVRCAMFRSRTNQIKSDIKEGDQVELRAKVSLYEQRGDYQLIVEGMKPAGEGALLLAYEQLKHQLMQEGLFDQTHKQALPVIKRLALITSPTGAAIHDMLTVLKRRQPGIEVDIYPTQVQGKAATPQIVAAIARANRDNKVDALILGRGGGSLEDLWCFNEEAVARAVFHSSLPVISAIGHEPDVTIVDFIADVRAPTPSAAAELVSNDQRTQERQLAVLEEKIQQQWQRLYLSSQQALQQLAQQLVHPARRIQGMSQHVDQLSIRLQQNWSHQIRQRHNGLQHHQQTLHHLHPQHLLKQRQATLERLDKQLRREMQSHLTRSNQAVSKHASLLNSLSPLQVLGRGYSLTRQGDAVVQDVKYLEQGDRVHTHLHQGWFECQITDIHNDNVINAHDNKDIKEPK